MIKIPTSSSWWIFDDDRSRFRKIPRDVNPDSFALDNDWQSYFELEVDAEGQGFTVYLNDEKTRLMRGYIDEDVNSEELKDIFVSKGA